MKRIVLLFVCFLFVHIFCYPHNTLVSPILERDKENHGDRFLILPAINEDLYPLIQ